MSDISLYTHYASVHVHTKCPEVFHVCDNTAQYYYAKYRYSRMETSVIDLIRHVLAIMVVLVFVIHMKHLSSDNMSLTKCKPIEVHSG